jgi:hypothetical protein
MAIVETVAMIGSIIAIVWLTGFLIRELFRKH